MEFHISDIIISIINIFVLFFLLRIILWKPVNRYLAGRQERIKNEVEGARKMRQDAEALEADYKQKFSDIKKRGDELILTSKREASKEADAIIEEGKAEVDRMMREAKERIAEERQQAVADAQADIVNLATEMAASILRREVSDMDNTNAADKFFEMDYNNG